MGVVSTHSVKMRFLLVGVLVCLAVAVYASPTEVKNTDAETQEVATKEEDIPAELSAAVEEGKAVEVEESETKKSNSGKLRRNNNKKNGKNKEKKVKKDKNNKNKKKNKKNKRKNKNNKNTRKPPTKLN